MKQPKHSGLLLFILLIGFNFTASSQTVLISNSANWKYYDAVNAANIASLTGWTTAAFSDAGWGSGPAQLGYGDGDEATVVGYGPDPNNKYVSTYFRKTITMADPTAFTDFTFSYRRDDGIVIYVNGVEIRRDNMPVGAISYTTLSATNAADEGNTTYTFTVPSSTFIAGNNTIAAEIHQTNVTSTDISFVLGLTGNLNTALLPYGGSWSYLVTPSFPGVTWADSTFNDTGWPTGNAELGYGDGDEATTITFGPDANNKYPTTYFRKKFTIGSLASFASFTLDLIRDDGAVVYVNGIEVARDNLPTGAISYNTLAPTGLGAPAESTPVSFLLMPSYFVQGQNTIAVEMHQNAGNSTDLSFNLQLTGNPDIPVTLTRGPYLQMGNQTEATLRWRSDFPSNSRIEVGTAYGTYTIAANNPTVTTEHVVRITGLTANTKYYYSFGSSTQVLQSGIDNFFHTAPLPNTNAKTRVVAFGDCGRGVAAFQTGTLNNYRNYLTTQGIDAADVWMLLGDNAYNAGTDAEYTSNFFTPYQSTIMKNHMLFPAPGNHDYANDGTRQVDHNVPYFQNFTVPYNAECGGTASTVPRYYSYDYGDIHFLSLDSYGIEDGGTTRLYDTLGAQVTWVKNDLANNTKKWVVAYWHHAPYTMSTHNSDSETELRDIRVKFIRILERLGVDMVVCGHAHAYERSYLIKGHYGLEATFSIPTHAVSNSSAKYDGSANSCPYVTPLGKVDHGIVYIVAGSTGTDGTNTGSFPHNALPFNDDDAGMLYFEVQDNRLDAKYLRRDGSIPDQFTIIKDANKNITISATVGQQVTLTSSWAGNYNWTPTGQTAVKTIDVTPVATGPSVYYVKDNLSTTCLSDTFTINATAALPVNLVDFTAQLKNEKVYLNWSISNETNNDYFSIERSQNGSQFSLLGKVNSVTSSNSIKQYSLTDDKPLTGLSYYRLSQSDKDGVSRILGTRKVNVVSKSDNLRVWVAQDNQQPGVAAVRIVSNKRQQVQLNILDAGGAIVRREQFQVEDGLNAKNYSLKPGVYIIDVKDERGYRTTHKIVVGF